MCRQIGPSVGRVTRSIEQKYLNTAGLNRAFGLPSTGWFATHPQLEQSKSVIYS